MFDAATGRVFDNVNVSGRVGRFALTYNQSTFVGAAHLLGFHDEARLAAYFTMNAMGRDGYLPAGGENFPSIVIRPSAPLRESTLFTFSAK